MRIAANEKIAGYPALQIRRLMRETVGRSINLRYVREVLDCSKPSAARVLNQLEKGGFIESVRDSWEATIKGSALAMATAAAPLRRETAERLVQDVVRRARLVNDDNSWAYRVGIVVVFGGYARGVERPNDVDIGCALRPRCLGDEQRHKEQERREKRAERFRNICE